MNILEMDGTEAIRFLGSRFLLFVLSLFVIAGAAIGAAAIGALLYGVVMMVARYGYGVELPNPVSLFR